MPDRIVINTGPLIALVAAWGDLTLLSLLYRQVLVPLEVKREIEAGGRKQFAVAEFAESDVLKVWPHELRILPFPHTDVLERFGRELGRIVGGGLVGQEGGGPQN